MAISPAPSSSGPMKGIGNVLKDNTQKAQQKRLESENKVEKQRVRQAKPTRRARTKEAAERARARRAEEKRGQKLDVRA